MPRIPVPEVRVAPSPLPSVRQPRATAGAFGAGAAQGVQSLGGSAFRAASQLQQRQERDLAEERQVLERLKQEEDVLLANNSLLKAQTALQEFLSNPVGNDRPPGILNRVGAQAAGSVDLTRQRMKDIRDEFTQNLSPTQRELFTSQWEPAALRTIDKVSAREIEQVKVAQNFQSQQLRARAAEDVKIDRADQALVQKHLDDIAKHTAALNPGVGQAALEILQKDATTPALAAAVAITLYERDADGRRNFAGAEKFLADNMRHINFEVQTELARKIEEVRDFEVADEMFDYLQEVAPHFGFDELMDTFESITSNPRELDYLRKWSKSLSVEKHGREWESFLRVVEPSSDQAADRRAAASLPTVELRSEAAALVARKYKLSADQLKTQQLRASADHLTRLTNFVYEQARATSPEWLDIQMRVLLQASEEGLDVDEADKRVEAAWQEFQRRGDPIIEEEIPRLAREVILDPEHQKNMLTQWDARRVDQDRARKRERERLDNEIEKVMAGMTATEAADFVASQTGDNKVKAQSVYSSQNIAELTDPILIGNLARKIMRGITAGKYDRNGQLDRDLVAADAKPLPTESKKLIQKYMDKESPVTMQMIAGILDNFGFETKESNKRVALWEAVTTLLPGQNVTVSDVEKVITGLYFGQNVPRKGLAGFNPFGKKELSLADRLFSGDVKNIGDTETVLQFVGTTKDERKKYHDWLVERGVEPPFTENMLKKAELIDLGLAPRQEAQAQLFSQDIQTELDDASSLGFDVSPEQTPPDPKPIPGNTLHDPRSLEIRRALILRHKIYMPEDATLIELEQALEDLERSPFINLTAESRREATLRARARARFQAERRDRGIGGFREAGGIDLGAVREEDIGTGPALTNPRPAQGLTIGTRAIGLSQEEFIDALEQEGFE